jgi:hypothetical protein
MNEWIPRVLPAPAQLFPVYSDNPTQKGIACAILGGFSHAEQFS